MLKGTLSKLYLELSDCFYKSTTMLATCLPEDFSHTIAETSIVQQEGGYLMMEVTKSIYWLLFEYTCTYHGLRFFNIFTSFINIFLPNTLVIHWMIDAKETAWEKH